MKYKIVAAVDQIVTKEVILSVEASSEEQAQEKAREALQDFPAPISVSGVLRVLVSSSKYWIPRDITIKTVTKVAK